MPGRKSLFGHELRKTTTNLVATPTSSGRACLAAVADGTKKRGSKNWGVSFQEADLQESAIRLFVNSKIWGLKIFITLQIAISGK